MRSPEKSQKKSSTTTKKSKKSKIPKWALTFKEKGTEIRSINGHLYLYKITSKRSKEKGRPVKITLGCIGKITKEGIFKSKRRQFEEAVQHISIYEYGFSHWLFHHNQDLIQSLQSSFPNEWKYLVIALYMRLLYQAPMKNYPFLFAFAFLHQYLSITTITPQKISQTLHQVGIQRQKMLDFFRKIVPASLQTLLIDITHVISQSQQLGMNQKGYNSELDFRPQIKFLCLYAYEPQMPVYYRVLSGDISDVKVLKNAVMESGQKQCVIIGDKGFHSKKNREYLEQEGLRYIMPLKRDSGLIEEERLKSLDKKGWEGYFMYRGWAIWYYRYEVEGREIFVFLDERLRVEEQDDYLKRMEAHYEGYTMERYYELQLRFGTLALMTNVEERDGSKVYGMYKSRHAIEQMYDVFKNVLDGDRMYVRNRESLEGWMFVHYLAMLMWYRIERKLKEKRKEEKYSPRDTIEMLSRIQKLKVGEQWVMGEYPKKYEEVLRKLGVCIV